MKSRATPILLAVVIALGLFYVFFTLRQPDRRDYRALRDRVFAPEEFDNPQAATPLPLPSTATMMEWREGDERITVTRPLSGAGWQLIRPVTAPADTAVVTTFLDNFEYLKCRRAMKAAKGGHDLAAYALSPAARSVTVHQGRKQWTLDIGAATPDGQAVYVRSPAYRADEVFVIAADAVAGVFPSLISLRDKAALRFYVEPVTRVEVLGGAAPVALRRTPAGWRLTTPVDDEANPDAVAHLLKSLNALRIEGGDFLADDDARAAEFGLDRPSLVFAVYEGETRRALLIGGPAPNRPGKRCARREGEPNLFALPQAALDALPVAVARLRSRAVVHFIPDEVTAIELAASAQPTTRLTRTDGQWRMEGGTADDAQVKLLLNDLRNLEVSDWIDAPTAALLAEAGLEPPRLVLTVTTREGARRVRFGNPTAKFEFTHARRDAQGPILIVPSDLPTRLSAGRLAFVSRAVMEFRKEAATGIEIARPDGRVTLQVRDGRWTILRPDGSTGDANAARVDDLLWALSYHEAKRLVADAPSSLAEYGLDAPRLIVTVRTPAPLTLRIGKEADAAAFYAMMEGNPRLFTVGRALVNQLMADFAK